MATIGVSGGEIGQALNELANAGVFAYLLPFLLMVAVVFGILSKIKLFEDKSINAIISIVVGFMALQLNYVSVFFSEVFPRVGVGVAVILIVIIFLGLFTPTNKAWGGFIYLGIGAVILIAVLVQSAGATGWYTGYWWYDHWPKVIGAVVIIAIFGIIFGAKDNTVAETPMMKILKNI